MILAAAAALAAVATLASAWITGLALLWDTQWRLTYCIGSVLICLVSTTVLAVLAFHRSAPGPYTSTLKNEAAQDLALLQEWRRAE